MQQASNVARAADDSVMMVCVACEDLQLALKRLTVQFGARWIVLKSQEGWLEYTRFILCARCQVPLSRDSRISYDLDEAWNPDISRRRGENDKWYRSLTSKVWGKLSDYQQKLIEEEAYTIDLSRKIKNLPVETGVVVHVPVQDMMEIDADL